MSAIEKTVFISYRRTDVYPALAVDQSLKSRGYDVFFDYTSIPSGDFEQIIVSNIKARAHFVLILTPTALDRCNAPDDWLRREIETALEMKRNIIPLFFKGFKFDSTVVSEKLTGKLKDLSRFNGMNVHEDYFREAMERLHEQYLNVPINAVLHHVSAEVEDIVKMEQAAANKKARQLKKDGLIQGMKDGFSEQAAEEEGTLPAEETESQPSKPLILRSTEKEIVLRSQPIISPDTLIRRIPITETLVSIEPAKVGMAKIGVPNKWIKVRDLSGKEGYIAAWLVARVKNI